MSTVGEISDALVIGAGLAGLAAARDLTRAGLSVRVLEKSGGVSGRAATRRLEVSGEELRVDHGAQFFTARGEGLGGLIPMLLETGTGREWTRGFAHLGPSGIEEGSPGHPRYVCPAGMSALGKLFARGWMATDAPLHVETSALVSAIWPSSNGWSAVLENGDLRHGRALIVNAPAPQALSLVRSYLPSDLLSSLEAVRFDPCWAAVVALQEMPSVAWPALEIDHPLLRWAAMDHTRRAPGAAPVLVLHAQGAWSREHLELDPDAALERMVNAARELFGDWVRPYRAAFAHRWRYALPTVLYPHAFVAHENLALCGDWCGGSRVEGALESGWASAAYLLERLEVGTEVRG